MLQADQNMLIQKLAEVAGSEPAGCDERIKYALMLEIKLAEVAGLEPANDGIKTRCLTTWRHPSNRVGSYDWT